MPIKPDELNRGPWTAEEDLLLTKYVQAHGIGSWSAIPKKAGLLRCGKSCRLRWMNYLRPNVKRGHISQDEEELIIRLHNLLGNRWSLIAGRMPGRTDNEVKNYWNTRLSKKLAREGIDPKTHRPLVSLADKKLIKKPFAIKSADLLKIKGLGSSDSSPNQKQLITKPTAPQEETCMNARPDTIRTTADMALEASGMESVQGKNPPVPNGIVISSNVEYSTHEIHDVASELAEPVRVMDKTVEIMSDNTATPVGEAFVNLDAPSTADCMVPDGAEQEASNNSYYNVVTAMAHHYCLDDQLVLDFNYNIQHLNPYSEVGEYLYDFNCVHFDQEYQCQGTMLASDLWSLL